jgi:hypothetical protein
MDMTDFIDYTLMALRAAKVHENYDLSLMPLCQLGRLGQLSQWPMFNQPTQLAQRTQLVIFELNRLGVPADCRETLGIDADRKQTRLRSFRKYFFPGRPESLDIFRTAEGPEAAPAAGTRES